MIKNVNSNSCFLCIFLFFSKLQQKKKAVTLVVDRI